MEVGEAGIQMSAREQYVGRRTLVEGEFTKTPLQQEIVKRPDGSEVRVLSHCMTLPDELKSTRAPDGPIRVAVYCPGIWEAASPNTGNTREVNLLGSMVSGNADIIVVVKGEGLNDQAYTNNDDGIVSGAVQSKVGSAMAEVLEKQLAAMQVTDPANPPKYKFVELVGYSEGASQAASLALELSKRWKVDSLTAFAPAGITGVQDQETLNTSATLNTIFNNIKTSKTEDFGMPQFPIPNSAGQEVYHAVAGDNVFIDAKIIGNPTTATIPDGQGGETTVKVNEGFEGALGETAALNPMDDMKNVMEWFRRFAAPNPEHNVPAERVRAALTINPDYDKLVKGGVIVLVSMGNKDGFFNYRQMRAGVQTLRENNPGSHISFVTLVGEGHKVFHMNPNGAAYASQLAKEMVA